MCFWRCWVLFGELWKDGKWQWPEITHHLTPYGKAFRTNLLQLLTLCIWLCKHIWMNFFHPHFHVWKDHHYHQRFFCGEFSHPGTTKMKQEYPFAYSLFKKKYSCHFFTTLLNFRVWLLHLYTHIYLYLIFLKTSYNYCSVSVKYPLGITGTKVIFFKNDDFYLFLYHATPSGPGISEIMPGLQPQGPITWGMT